MNKMLSFMKASWPWLLIMMLLKAPSASTAIWNRFELLVSDGIGVWVTGMLVGGCGVWVGDAMVVSDWVGMEVLVDIGTGVWVVVVGTAVFVTRAIGTCVASGSSGAQAVRRSRSRIIDVRRMVGILPLECETACFPFLYCLFPIIRYSSFKNWQRF